MTYMGDVLIALGMKSTGTGRLRQRAISQDTMPGHVSQLTSMRFIGP